LSSTSANAVRTLWRYEPTASSSAASLRTTLLRLRPPSISGIDSAAPSSHERLLHLKTSAKLVPTPPAPAARFSAGNIAERATPMRALAASIVRWALAMSGRRSSKVDGRPAGISGSAAASLSGSEGAAKFDAGLPSRTDASLTR